MKKAKMVDIEVVIDSTGIKNRNDGEYRATKYGKKKEWCKIHIAVDSKTKQDSKHHNNRQ